MKERRSGTDGQVTSLAGELFVAAELLKRGLQTSITFGAAKAIDLLAYNPQTEKVFTVQVKAVRKRNAFPIAYSRVHPKHTYIFVILNEPGVATRYFVVPGTVLVNESERFTKWFKDPKFPGIPPAALEPFENAWSLFDQ